MRQDRSDEALELHTEVKEAFERLGEPAQVAVAFHHIGMVRRHAGQYDQAEDAYRQSLSMWVQQRNRGHEAMTLGELGNLYDDMDRLEDAVTFIRQAADVYVGFGDLRHEGIQRNNLGKTLIRLERYDEARSELRRAIECDEPFGHAAEPWKTWGNLDGLERTVGNTEVAAEARAKAIESYLSYRRDGGQSQSAIGNIVAPTMQAIQQGENEQASRELSQLLEGDIATQYKVALPKLKAILDGDRSPRLAEDPDLHPVDAVELLLLLEGLGG